MAINSESDIVANLNNAKTLTEVKKIIFRATKSHTLFINRFLIMSNLIIMVLSLVLNGLIYKNAFYDPLVTGLELLMGFATSSNYLSNWQFAWELDAKNRSLKETLLLLAKENSPKNTYIYTYFYKEMLMFAGQYSFYALVLFNILPPSCDKLSVGKLILMVVAIGLVSAALAMSAMPLFWHQQANQRLFDDLLRSPVLQGSHPIAL